MAYLDKQLFINRELSWLAFNERVLEEARDATLPLHERIKFLSIASSNLDEFFMVRVAGLKQQMNGGVAELPADGMLPVEQLTAIAERTHQMTDSMYDLWNHDIVPLLALSGLHLLKQEALSSEQKHAARTYFQSSVFPALTPLAIDPGHPFPHLRNKSLNLAIEVRRSEKRRKRDSMESALAVVQVPSVLPRLVSLPTPDGLAFLLLEELILLQAGDLFPGYTVENTTTFRLTRNWDLDIDEEESQDLLESIQTELRRRDRGAVVRMELDARASPALETQLITALQLAQSDVYRLCGPLQLQDFLSLSEGDPRQEHHVEALIPVTQVAITNSESMVQLVGQRDVLLHHPYESFDPVVRFVEEAAEDPSVLAIKQTLYRTGGDSPIGRALLRASENGKQVTVLVELKARLDEANNIAWARRMEDHGVHVVYGLIGLKTHCKMILVVRREGNGIRRYVHLGTGNYNPATARAYADLSFFTARTEIADDATALFNFLTGYSKQPNWKRLSVAPVSLQSMVLELIARETRKAEKGEPARIIAKLNALVDAPVIRALYAASQAGVSIELIIRGICCLRPGIPGVSDRIRVINIIDRFLEHTRTFAFGTGAHTDVYISSADWMPRNFHRRVEVMAPIEDPLLKARVLEEVLGSTLRDNVKARRLLQDGTYMSIPLDSSDGIVRSQLLQFEQARRQSQASPVDPPLMRHVTSKVTAGRLTHPQGSAM